MAWLLTEYTALPWRGRQDPEWKSQHGSSDGHTQAHVLRLDQFKVLLVNFKFSLQTADRVRQRRWSVSSHSRRFLTSSALSFMSLTQRLLVRVLLAWLASFTSPLVKHRTQRPRLQTSCAGFFCVQRFLTPHGSSRCTRGACGLRGRPAPPRAPRPSEPHRGFHPRP